MSETVKGAKAGKPLSADLKARSRVAALQPGESIKEKQVISYIIRINYRIPRVITK